MSDLRQQRRLLLASAAALAWPVWAQTDEDGLQYEKIRAAGVLKVAVYKDHAPYSSEVDGQMVGLDVDIARALAAQMGLAASFLPFPAGEDMHADLRWMVERGHYLGMGPADLMMRVPVDRHLMFGNRKVFIFAPYMSERPVLLRDSQRLDEPRSPDDLQGKPLAAEAGAGLTSLLLGYGNGLLRDQVQLHPTAMAAADAVIRGQAVAAYITRAQAEAAMARSGASVAHLRLDDLALHHMAARGWPIGVAIKASNRPLRLAVEEAMQALQASGKMLEVFRQHRLTLTAP
jgi:ABC-type amino acid transport substrate-binding protein